ncbi:armadillo-type protein [Lyophyllum atratum]|nr:armadillo-type protein [Lyophyllum atratum]
MEVPFISSGASSRAHYSLVRKIEYADSTQSANQHLVTEIESIRRQLADPALSLDECRNCLILLLYCYMNVSHGFLALDAFNFALSHAITLAEAGRTITHKRIGYLFCAEVMPPHHELQLMLVNTLRKDLEHESIPRICLALENVIASSNEDLVPAVQSRIHDLLWHNSPHIRRRALLALRSLARHQPEWLSGMGREIVNRVEDPHPSVASAALVLSTHLAEIKELAPDARLVVNNSLTTIPLNLSLYKPWLLIRILHTLFFLGLSEDNIPTVLELIRSSSKSRDGATLRGAFLLLSKISPRTLLSFTPVEVESPIQSIRPFLISHDPNDIYLFLSCLECLDPLLWGGTSPDALAILDGWEVERIMQFLDSPDALIRRTTLRVLNSVDLGIVASYYSQAVENIPLGLSIDDMDGYVVRLMEIVETHSGENGEQYARDLKNLLVQVEQTSPRDHLVSDKVVEIVLNHFRNANTDFRVGFPATMLTFVVDADLTPPQTMMVIIAALATEQCGKLSIPPLDLLQGFASKLTPCHPSVKDACLLAMMRVAADCDDIPLSIIQSVADLGQNSRRHIRQRCEQFVTLAKDKTALAEIVKNARSSSLPDFLAALQDRSNQRPPTSPPAAPSSSRILSSSKLRYNAYDTPIPGPKLRTRESSRSPYSPRSSRLETLSDSGHDPLPRVSSRLSVSSADPLSRTMTPGDLTLAANRQELENMDHSLDKDLDNELVSRTPPRLETSTEPSIDDFRSHVDLILLDSPFVSDPADAVLDSTAEDEVDFGALWDSIEDGDARGWYNASIDDAVRRLQGLRHMRSQVISMDQPPFIGDLKVILCSRHVQAVLRLRESDEDSCLWRLRCADVKTCAQVKDVFTVDV